MKLLSLLAVAGLALGSLIPQSQVPLSLPGGFTDKPNPYETFVKHFSAQRAGTNTYLQSTLSTLYPNSTITTTQDYAFNLLSFSSFSPHLLIREKDDIGSLKRLVYIPNERRRDGNGFIAEGVVFGGYTVEWKDTELTAIVATWSEGWQLITQWHLISSKEDEKAAVDLIHSCGVWSTTLREAVLVFQNGYWQPEHNLWEAIQKASWDDVILDKDFAKRLRSDYTSFFKSEGIYKELGVPWKRGLIFLGPPGNGKTISLKAILHEVGLPALYVKSFKSWMGDEASIREVFQRARAEAPCVLVMEDLDSLITDENRSFFLNEVDGFEDNDGLLLIGTTNHEDRLDPALSNRPSRFDRKYNFPNPNVAERKAYAIYWQKKLSTNHEIDFPDSLVTQIAANSKKFSMAYLKEAFVSTLLTLAGREDQNDGQTFAIVILDQIEKLRESLEALPEIMGGVSGKTKGGDGEGRMRREVDMMAFRESCVVGSEGRKCFVRGDDRLGRGMF